MKSDPLQLAQEIHSTSFLALIYSKLEPTCTVLYKLRRIDLALRNEQMQYMQAIYADYSLKLERNLLCVISSESLMQINIFRIKFIFISILRLHIHTSTSIKTAEIHCKYKLENSSMLVNVSKSLDPNLISDNFEINFITGCNPSQCMTRNYGNICKVINHSFYTALHKDT